MGFFDVIVGLAAIGGLAYLIYLRVIKRNPQWKDKLSSSGFKDTITVGGSTKNSWEQNKTML